MSTTMSAGGGGTGLVGFDDVNLNVSPNQDDYDMSRVTIAPVYVAGIGGFAASIIAIAAMIVLLAFLRK